MFVAIGFSSLLNVTAILPRPQLAAESMNIMFRAHAVSPKREGDCPVHCESTCRDRKSLCGPRLFVISGFPPAPNQPSPINYEVASTTDSSTDRRRKGCQAIPAYSYMPRWSGVAYQAEMDDGPTPTGASQYTSPFTFIISNHIYYRSKWLRWNFLNSFDSVTRPGGTILT